MSAEDSSKAAGPMTALLVEPNTPDALRAYSALSAAGFYVTIARSFDTARQVLAANPPTVLIAAVHLAEYNGLHLVIRGKYSHPLLTAVVMSDQSDTVLQAEAERLGATFAVKPLDESEILSIVFRMLSGGADSRPIRPPYERRNSERRALGGPLPVVERRRVERRTLPSFTPVSPQIKS